MIRLVFFALRKSVFYRGMALALAVSILSNLAFLIYDSAREDYRAGWEMDDLLLSPLSTETNVLDYIRSLHDTYDGPITREKVLQSIQAEQTFQSQWETRLYTTEYDPIWETGYFFGDYRYFEATIFNPLQYAATYADQITEKLAEAESQCTFYTDVGNASQVSYWEQIKKAYQGRNISEFYDVQAWRYLFEYQFSDLIILLLLLLSQMSSGSQEVETGMAPLIASSFCGKKDLYLAKPLASLLWTGGLVLFFALMNFSLMKIIFGLSGASQPLYALSCYQDTLLTLSMREFYLLLTFRRVLAFSVLSLVVCVISRHINHTVPAFCFTLFFLVLVLWMGGFALAETRWKGLLSLLSPFTLLQSPATERTTKGVFLVGKFFPVESACTWIQVGLLYILLQINLIHAWPRQEREVRRVIRSVPEAPNT